MKVHCFADLLDILGPYDGRAAVGVSKLTEAIRLAPASTTLSAGVAKIAACIADARTIPEGSDVTLNDIVPALERASKVLQLAGTKPDIATANLLLQNVSATPQIQLDNLSNIFAKKKTTVRTKLPKPPNSAVIDQHASQLKRSSPGTSEYEVALQSLREDKAAKAAEMKEIASTLGIEVGSDATRAAALKAISKAHKIIYDTVAKVNAMRGQSAT